MPKLSKANLDHPDEVRDFDHGRLDVVNLGEETIGRQIFEPGWRWSDHVQPIAGTPTCELHHIGMLLAGHMRAEMVDGSTLDIGPNDVYEMPPGHDAWVVGDEPAVSIQWTGVRTWGAPLLATGERILTTLLFTDIIGSTSTATRLGDTKWRELLATHNDQVRRALDRFGGIEVSTTGDGFLARFDGPVRALRCAAAIHRAAGEMDIQVRAAVHTGEVELLADDVRGVAVHLAARILGLAQPGETLVSSTTRDLADGSEMTFEERGRHELKGINGVREVFAVVRG